MCFFQMCYSLYPKVQKNTDLPRSRMKETGDHHHAHWPRIFLTPQNLVTRWCIVRHSLTPLPLDLDRDDLVSIFLYFLFFHKFGGMQGNSSLLGFYCVSFFYLSFYSYSVYSPGSSSSALLLDVKIPNFLAQLACLFIVFPLNNFPGQFHTFSWLRPPPLTMDSVSIEDSDLSQQQN